MYFYNMYYYHEKIFGSVYLDNFVLVVWLCEDFILLAGNRIAYRSFRSVHNKLITSQFN